MRDRGYVYVTKLDQRPAYALCPTKGIQPLGKGDFA